MARRGPPKLGWRYTLRGEDVGLADVREPTITLREADLADAEVMLHVIRAAFLARPAVDPPAEALSETVADIRVKLSRGTGLLAYLDDELVGCLLISQQDQTIGLHRVSVVPGQRHHGVAAHLVRGAALVGLDLGATRVELVARVEFPELISWWRGHGFEVDREVPHGVVMARALPHRVKVHTAEAMFDLGVRVSALLRAGDLIIAVGDLGAGKTTLTQGIGAGLGVTGAVISPTFVLSRIHPNPAGPDLVHVDAYRLSSAAELEDIDLESGLADSITLIEWGSGIAEWLSDNRLEIEIQRSLDPADEAREVFLTGYGPRWAGSLEGI